MQKTVYDTNDRKKNIDLLNVIKSGLGDLKNEIENTSEEEKEIEKPNEIVDIVEQILEFNDQTQRGQGLRILTPNQMLSILLITLAQLKAGNSSEKLIWHWIIQVFITQGETLNQHTTTTNLKFQHQLGIMNLICLMDHILLQTSKATLNLSSKTRNFSCKCSHTNLPQ